MCVCVCVCVCARAKIENRKSEWQKILIILNLGKGYTIVNYIILHIV